MSATPREQPSTNDVHPDMPGHPTGFPTRRAAPCLGPMAWAVAVGMGLAWSVASSGAAAAPRPGAVALVARTQASASPLAVLAALARRAPADKLDASLRTAAEVRGAEADRVVLVKSATAVELTGVARWAHAWTWPAGEHLALAGVPVRRLEELAALPGVAIVQDADPGGVRRDALLWEGQETARPGPDDWFDAGPGHDLADAWSQGYQGAGVRLAIVDTPIDFAHEDLRDSWAVEPENSLYGGWPQMFDPYATYLYSLERATGDDFTGIGASGLISMTQTSAVTSDGTACFRPLVLVQGQRLLGVADCSWRVPATSGTVRLGFHPDTYLAGLGARPEEGVDAAWAGVLLVEGATSDDDVVYVDLNGDRDFTDEAPLSRRQPLAARDLDGDGVADLSGGLLYWISDGVHPVPGAYLWGLADDVPARDALVAVTFDDYDVREHGTLCASAAASRGRLGVPPGVGLGFRDGPALDGFDIGAAPAAQIVGIGNVYQGPEAVMESAWLYAVLGSDPDEPGDEAQIVSNSYGLSGTPRAADNDGWDLDSRTIDHYVREFGPTTTFLFATGNGGPGYGTLTAPSPATGIRVAASTTVGATGWDSITDTEQITFGDIAPFSGRGPGADGRVGPNVAANGAWGVGAVPINGVTTDESLPTAVRTGAAALVTWGGSSRATPLAAGELALVYQAWRGRTGEWPTADEARSVLMAGARDVGYDVFAMGAGVTDAGDAARIAAGTHGIYIQPGEWQAGDYHGARHDGFAKVVQPGQAVPGTFTIQNPGPLEIQVSLSAQVLRKVGSYDDVFATLTASESPPLDDVPAYLAPVDRRRVPAGTDLLVVTALEPMDHLDGDGNGVADNPFSLGVLRHTDVDGDGRLWEDVNGDGTVSYILDGTSGLDRATQPDWSTAEIDRWEYARFAATEGDRTGMTVAVHHPLERWGDGLYVALWHPVRCGSAGCVGRSLPETELPYRVDFYRYEPWDWLVVDDDVLAVPGHGSADVAATLYVPPDAPTGAVEGALFADILRAPGAPTPAPGAGWEHDVLRTVVPVVAHVAATALDRPLVLGGAAGSDAEAAYDNGSVRPATDWSWRAEAGDWRFFFIDITTTTSGRELVTRTQWRGDPGGSDVDTLIFGPTADRFTDPADPANKDEDWFDGEAYGPYTLASVAASAVHYQGTGRWGFGTTSGGPEDWLATPLRKGLHEIALQNVRAAGDKMTTPLTTTVGIVHLTPRRVLAVPGACLPIELAASIDLPDLEVASFGLAAPDTRELSLHADPPADPSAAAVKIDLAVPADSIQLEAGVKGRADDDIDLYLIRDQDGDGRFTLAERVGLSVRPGSDEAIHLWRPEPGAYQLWVHAWKVAPGASRARLTTEVLAGHDIELRRVPTAVAAGQAVELEACLPAGASLDDGRHGVIVLGPGGAPDLFTLDLAAPAARIALPWLEAPR